MVTPPAFPTAPELTLVRTPVNPTKSPVNPTKSSPPSIVMVSLAVILTEPAFPSPEVSVSISPPLLRIRVPVLIMISPASPTASELTSLVTSLSSPLESTPSIVIVLLAIILIKPAFPSPEVSLLISPPLLRVRVPVSMVTSPASP